MCFTKIRRSSHTCSSAGLDQHFLWQVASHGIAKLFSLALGGLLRWSMKSTSKGVCNITPASSPLPIWPANDGGLPYFHLIPPCQRAVAHIFVKHTSFSFFAGSPNLAICNAPQEAVQDVSRQAAMPKYVVVGALGEKPKNLLTAVKRMAGDSWQPAQQIC